MAKYPHMVARELGQSFDRRRFVAALRGLVPEIYDEDLVPSGAGVRAQAMNVKGELIHDFVWSQSPGAVHVINAPSPAATASLSIGEEIATRVRQQLVS
jgi:L-2-hydroxyglutarate oxidase LhgO